MKDEYDKRVNETAELLDYVELLDQFIVQVYDKRYFMHRLCIQITVIETKQTIEERRV